MTPKKVLITGATGLIGKKLYKALVRRGDEVTVFTRSMVKGVQRLPGADEFIEWDYTQKNHWQGHVSGKGAVVHLSGANLFDRRWNKEYKQTIVESRQVSTRNLVDAMEKADKRPGVFICSSAVGYYGDKGDEVVTESAAPGGDFLAEVCKVWESEASKAESLGIRRVSIRTGVVLNKEGGALKKMLLPFRLFAGGPLGSGRQWFPWVHIDDIVRAYLYAIDNEQIEGDINVTAPVPVTMSRFAKALGGVLHRPSLFPVPEFVLRLVAGESASAVVSSIRAIPDKLQKAGFKFSYENVENALKSLLVKNSVQLALTAGLISIN
jgi:uncharacterized protein (TIGR01777 family)